MPFTSPFCTLYNFTGFTVTFLCKFGEIELLKGVALVTILCYVYTGKRIEGPGFGKTKPKQLSLLPVPRVGEHPMRTAFPPLSICGARS